MASFQRQPLARHPHCPRSQCYRQQRWGVTQLLRTATVGAILAFSLASCGPNPPSASGSAPRGGPAPASVEVQVAPVRKLQAVRNVDVTGTLFGDIETSVAAKVAGRISALHVDLGSVISTGDSLAELEQADYLLELAQRERSVDATLSALGLASAPTAEFDLESVPSVRQRRSEAANAKAKFDRAQRLFDQTPPLIAEQDLADLRTAWTMADDAAESAVLDAKALIAKAAAEQAAVEIAKQRLSDAKVLAPTGEKGEKRTFHVAEKLVAIGELMTPGTPMFRLVAVDPIRFRASVPERFASAVSVGQQASLQPEGVREAVRGQVSRVAPRIDERSRTFDVEITIDNADNRLKPGAFARGGIDIRRDENVIFVPEAAVVTFAGVERVFSVKDGKAVAHRIRTGQRQDGLVEVIGSLDASEVVVRNAANLSQDAPVTLASSS
jgi:RND family efflux transporter MFP subunit